MSWKNPPDHWGGVSQLLHWVIVVLLVVLSVVGLSLDSLPRSPKYVWVYDMHKSTGLTVLALVVLRLGWRFYAGAPRPLPGTPTWQARVASVTHWLLYALILAMPLSGWLYDSASGLRPLQWFGLFAVPKLVGADEDLADDLHDLHEDLFAILVVVALLHVAAAVWHHVFRGDATLARMLPRGWLRVGSDGA